MRPLFLIFLSLALWACDSDTPPEMIYIPAGEQNVRLSVSIASTHLTVGEPAVLSAERWQTGAWQRIARRVLAPDQCWMAAPPRPHEDQVADNLRWQSSPV